MIRKSTAEMVVKYTEKKLKEEPEYESLSDEGKAICLLLGSCMVISKLCDVIFKGVKEFYERYY